MTKNDKMKVLKEVHDLLHMDNPKNKTIKHTLRTLTGSTRIPNLIEEDFTTEPAKGFLLASFTNPALLKIICKVVPNFNDVKPNFIQLFKENKNLIIKRRLEYNQDTSKGWLERWIKEAETK